MKNLMKQITKNGRIFWVTYFTFFLILAMPTHAWAYVDPATFNLCSSDYCRCFYCGWCCSWCILEKNQKAFL